MGQSSALTFTNEALIRLTDILDKFAHLESVSLVANAKLGFTERRDGAVADFIARVGRKCKVRHTNVGNLARIYDAAI